MTSFLLFTPAAFAYGYTFRYPMVHTSALSADEVWTYVNSHFSELFPATYAGGECGDTLYVGEVCDLVGLDNKGLVRVEEVGSRHFVLRSLPGHGEGANKRINFTFQNEPDGTLSLVVKASGKDNLWQQVPFGKRGNRLLADSMWSQFAYNVTRRINLGLVG